MKRKTNNNLKKKKNKTRKIKGGEVSDAELKKMASELICTEVSKVINNNKTNIDSDIERAIVSTITKNELKKKILDYIIVKVNTILKDEKDPIYIAILKLSQEALYKVFDKSIKQAKIVKENLEVKTIKGGLDIPNNISPDMFKNAANSLGFSGVSSNTPQNLGEPIDKEKISRKFIDILCKETKSLMSDKLKESIDTVVTEKIKSYVPIIKNSIILNIEKGLITFVDNVFERTIINSFNGILSNPTIYNNKNVEKLLLDEKFKKIIYKSIEKSLELASPLTNGLFEKDVVLNKNVCSKLIDKNNAPEKPESYIDKTKKLLGSVKNKSSSAFDSIKNRFTRKNQNNIDTDTLYSPLNQPDQQNQQNSS